MSLISSFVQTQLVKALEAEFIAHEPQLQAAFLAELESFAKQTLSWVSDKIKSKQQPKE